jgi:hypothetical protein
LAVVLAESGQIGEARVTLHEAVGLYDGLQAASDIRRADSRLRPHGIRRGVRSRRGPHTASGWKGAHPNEVRIATMVAKGGHTEHRPGHVPVPAHRAEPTSRTSSPSSARKAESISSEQMFIAQPTLSQQIRRLEEMVGTPFFQRRREGGAADQGGQPDVWLPLR